MQGGAYTSCHVPEQVSRLCIFALGRFCLSLRYPLDDLLWCHRKFIDLDAQGLERILYYVMFPALLIESQVAPPYVLLRHHL